MKDKIKEIRDYIACPQLGDDYYGEWGALRLDQRLKIKSLLDYITNLQEYYNVNVNKYEELLVKYSNLLEEVNKAKEFLNNEDIIVKLQEFENKYTVNFYDKKVELLSILTGDDSDE